VIRKVGDEKSFGNMWLGKEVMKKCLVTTWLGEEGKPDFA
jgi:hypothetical protein